MFDYHVHTNFSFDGKVEPEQIIEEGLRAGLREICITDHADVFPGENATALDLPRYHQAIDRCKGAFQEIVVKKGIELGVDKDTVDIYHRLCQENSFDFIICSQHFVNGVDPFDPIFFQGRSVREAYEEYLEDTIKTLSLFSQYSVAGHIGYPAKYCKANDPRMTYREYGDWIDVILRQIISQGKGIEVNTSGYIMTGETIPAYDVLKRYAELGGEIVTVGSDAHNPERVGQNINRAIQAVKDAGLKYICTFEDMKPIFHPIEK